MNEYIWPPPTAPKAARAFDHITEAEECRHAIREWQPAAVSALEWGGPVRTGTPRAGDAGYEPAEVVIEGIDWPNVVGTILAALVLAAFWGTIIYRFARGVWPWQ